MMLEKIDINQYVSSHLGVFTYGAVFSNNGVGITLNLPDGDKKTIWGEWLHMTKIGTLAARVAMLQHTIYEEFPEYQHSIPPEWAR